uniref:Protein MIZU-KUSSEI 1 n=1 Tax=Salix viminalis TaxID=40686 RepID=A0A6N2MW50_SALVM
MVANSGWLSWVYVHRALVRVGAAESRMVGTWDGPGGYGGAVHLLFVGILFASPPLGPARLTKMKTIMATTPHDSSFSFSRRYFNWKKKVVEDEEDDDDEILTFNSSSHCEELRTDKELRITVPAAGATQPVQRKRTLSTVAVSRLRSALTVFSKSRSAYHSGLGSRVTGTLYGYRRGHVHFAFQEDAKKNPALLIELATPTSVLVREMASGLVRIALECEKKAGKKAGNLLEEPSWRTYCNGKKCGYASIRECRPEDWKVLKAVEPVSMGAGVLPGNGVEGSEIGELMYMRARFERVVGSKDSEAFYMMNPDGSGGPELITMWYMYHALEILSNDQSKAINSAMKTQINSGGQNVALG